MNSFIFENPQVNFCSPRSATDSLMNKSDIRGWFRKIKLITRILITLLHFIFHACARTSPAVSRQQTVVLTICHFTECLLTTVKHKLISQICEHIAVPMTTKLLASVIILFHYSRHRFTIHCSPMPVLFHQDHDYILPWYSHNGNCRHFVLDLGRLDTKRF